MAKMVIWSSRWRCDGGGVAVGAGVAVEVGTGVGVDVGAGVGVGVSGGTTSQDVGTSAAGDVRNGSTVTMPLEISSKKSKMAVLIAAGSVVPHQFEVAS